MNILAIFVPLGWPSLKTVMLISSSISCGPSKLIIKLKRASFWNLSMLQRENFHEQFPSKRKKIDPNEDYCMKFKPEEFFISSLNIFSCLNMNDFHIEINVFIPTGSFICE